MFHAVYGPIRTYPAATRPVDDFCSSSYITGVGFQREGLVRSDHDRSMTLIPDKTWSHPAMPTVNRSLHSPVGSPAYHTSDFSRCPASLSLSLPASISLFPIALPPILLWVTGGSPPVNPLWPTIPGRPSHLQPIQISSALLKAFALAAKGHCSNLLKFRFGITAD